MTVPSMFVNAASERPAEMSAASAATSCGNSAMASRGIVAGGPANAANVNSAANRLAIKVEAEGRSTQSPGWTTQATRRRANPHANRSRDCSKVATVMASRVVPI